MAIVAGLIISSLLDYFLFPLFCSFACLLFKCYSFFSSVSFLSNLFLLLIS